MRVTRPGWKRTPRRSIYPARRTRSGRGIVPTTCASPAAGTEEIAGLYPATADEFYNCSLGQWRRGALADVHEEPPKVYKVSEVELPQFFNFLSRTTGIILVTGPTGSGKTTTLYSALKYLAKPEVNIVTIEDPIEMVHEEFNQVAVRPAIDVTFANALRNSVATLGGPASPSDLARLLFTDFGDEMSTRDEILKALAYTRGHQGRAASLLGISRKALWEKRRRLGIP